MAHRRSGFQKKIDVVHWTYGSFSFLAQAAGTVAVNVFPAQHLPETLLRIRGEFLGYFDSGLTGGQLVGGSLGLILVPEGTDTTVLWSPVSDGDAPWIWVDYFMLGYEETVTDVIAPQVAMSVRRVIDSKAMRKIRNTELQCVIEMTSVSSSAPVNVAGQIRGLTGS